MVRVGVSPLEEPGAFAVEPKAPLLCSAPPGRFSFVGCRSRPCWGSAAVRRSVPGPRIRVPRGGVGDPLASCYSFAECRDSTRRTCERFSGLQLLSLMYVAFQQVNPSLDLHLPFEDAYRQALDMFRRHNEKAVMTRAVEGDSVWVRLIRSDDDAERRSEPRDYDK